MTVRVVVEVTPKRAFASAIDWPGWSRGGRDADGALAALLAYAPRYATVAARVPTAFERPSSPADLLIVERVAGDASTEFGVPAARALVDDGLLDRDELSRLLRLLDAAWETFEQTADRRAGIPLRTGPRGGGRQVPKIVEHVAEADRAYLGKLGSKPPEGSRGDVRRALIEAVTARAMGEPVPFPNRVRDAWPPRYAIRRAAWHALDHAWEIEDRAS